MNEKEKEFGDRLRKCTEEAAKNYVEDIKSQYPFLSEDEIVGITSGMLGIDFRVLMEKKS